MTTAYRLKDLAAKVRIESTYGAIKKPWDELDEWQRNAHPYRVTLRYKGRQMSLDFFMGQAHTDEPDAEGVLDCLLSDCSALDQSFEDWCGDFGYDTDSRKAEATYKACADLGKKVKRLLGDDFETFLYADRN